MRETARALGRILAMAALAFVAAAPLRAAAAPASGAPPASGTAPTAAASGTPPAGGTAPTAPAAEPSAVPGLYLGPASCGSSNCHGSVRPRRVLGVRQDEYFIWQKQDRHAQAYELLFNERSAAIARNLRLGAPFEQRACLDCHALAVPAGRQQRRLEIEDGISCEGCHGAASGWLESHRAEGETHERSVAAGMTDLRDLGVRAGVCLSCHLGAAGRTVDHELIAAGHPLLTFELDNYTEAMPPHWFAWADRPDKALRADTHGTPAWAAGQAAALRATLDQLAGRGRAQAVRAPRTPADDAGAAAGAGGTGMPGGAGGAEIAMGAGAVAGPGGAEMARSASGAATAVGAGGAGARAAGEAGLGRQWPDFAQLDCDSCHHSLAQERWRLGPRSDPPGLPRASPAPYAVLRAILAAAAPEQAAALDPEVDRLSRLLARFDTPAAEVAASAGRLARAAADLVNRLARARWDDERARRLLLALSDEHGAQEGADVQTARQIVLAAQTLVAQLVAGDRRWLAAGLAATAEGLSATVQAPYDFDRARLAALLAQLRRQLQEGPGPPAGPRGAAGAVR
jgi:hypothetical protein